VEMKIISERKGDKIKLKIVYFENEMREMRARKRENNGRKEGKA